MIYLPDTNAFSLYLSGRNEALRAKMMASVDDLRLSVVVLSELEYGAEKMPDRPQLRSRVNNLARLLEVIEFTRADAAFYGKVRAWLANLKPNAAPIGPMDLMIAAQAMRLGATVITNNTREFSRVPGLLVEDWQATS